MSDNIKHCKDCKFFDLKRLPKLLGLTSFGVCTKIPLGRSLSDLTDYAVSGKKIEVRYDLAERTRYWQCGVYAATYFEPKEK